MQWQDLIGKTIKSVDTDFGDNVVVVEFTDGTSTVIDTEAIGYGLYAPVIYSKDNYRYETVP